jgi:hypothetical protein
MTVAWAAYRNARAWGKPFLASVRHATAAMCENRKG